MWFPDLHVCLVEIRKIILQSLDNILICEQWQIPLVYLFTEIYRKLLVLLCILRIIILFVQVVRSVVRVPVLNEELVFPHSTSEFSIYSTLSLKKDNL